jgi:cytochrome oxidase Cu insertion factor (SCO1/SenC/PrrC family)
MRMALLSPAAHSSFPRMNDHIKKRLKRTGILCAVALVIGAGIGLQDVRHQNSIITQESKPIAGIKIGGPFTLTDQNGGAVTEKILEGKYALIYFGFTSCPAICPTELAKMTKALNALGAKADNIQPVFITVDPERDTPEVLKSYVTLFHPRLLGLTGSQAQIDAALKNYRIYATKRQEPNATDYTMDHSSFIYFINPTGELLSIFRTGDTAEMMAAEIGGKL